MAERREPRLKLFGAPALTASNTTLPLSGERRDLRKVLFRAHELPGTESLQANENALRWPVASDVLDFRLALAEGRTVDAVAPPFATLREGLDVAWSAEARPHRDRPSV